MLRNMFSDATVESFRTAGSVPNVLATLMHHPALAGPFTDYGNVLLRQPALGHRARELMLLRVAWRTGALYEWVHHVRLAAHHGLSDVDITAIMRGESANTWTPLECDFVSATDQLLDHYRIDDDTWSALAAQLDQRQLVEIPFVVGTYTCLAMAFNSWNMQIEESIEIDGIPLPRQPAGVHASPARTAREIGC
jgi:alkylhydroperoxidase family enzyme